MLLPSEKEAMLKQLEGAKVPLKPLKINPRMTQPVSPALQALLSKNNDLKACPFATAILTAVQEALTLATSALPDTCLVSFPGFHAARHSLGCFVQPLS